MKLEIIDYRGGLVQILYLPLEFESWFSAKKLAYPVGVGMIEGFYNNDIQHLTIPMLYNTDIWLSHIKAIVGDRKFDQVWVEVVHSIIPTPILEWIATLAPIRVGFIIESLTIAPGEFKDNPIGTQRRVFNLKSKLPYLTHAIVCDGRDIAKLNIPTMLYSPSIPKQLIRKPHSTNNKPIFYGTPYGDRKAWLNLLGDRITVNPSSQEDVGYLPVIFENFFLQRYQPSDYPDFFRRWYSNRQSLYAVWINCIHELDGCAMIGLPHRTEVDSGRNIENMAAGKPVISFLLNNDLTPTFEDGKNILYYKDMDGLIKCIDKLQKDPDLRFRLAEAAGKNILENYTTEIQVKRILEFIK